MKAYFLFMIMSSLFANSSIDSTAPGFKFEHFNEAETVDLTGTYEMKNEVTLEVELDFELHATLCPFVYAVAAFEGGEVGLGHAMAVYHKTHKTTFLNGVFPYGNSFRYLNIQINGDESVGGLGLGLKNKLIEKVNNHSNIIEDKYVFQYNAAARPYTVNNIIGVYSVDQDLASGCAVKTSYQGAQTRYSFLKKDPLKPQMNVKSYSETEGKKMTFFVPVKDVVSGQPSVFGSNGPLNVNESGVVSIYSSDNRASLLFLPDYN